MHKELFQELGYGNNNDKDRENGDPHKSEVLLGGKQYPL